MDNDQNEWFVYEGNLFLPICLTKLVPFPTRKGLPEYCSASSQLSPEQPATVELWIETNRVCILMTAHRLNPIWQRLFFNRQSLGGGAAWGPPIITCCCCCSDDHEIWHRHKAWRILHNGNKKFVTLLLLRNYDVIACILAHTEA